MQSFPARMPCAVTEVHAILGSGLGRPNSEKSQPLARVVDNDSAIAQPKQMIEGFVDPLISVKYL